MNRLTVDEDIVASGRIDGGVDADRGNVALH
jgi:hypothetical protein